MFRDSLHIHTQSQRGMFVRSAPALTCLPDLHTITAVMAPLPRDFTACEIETLQDDVGDATALPLIRTVKPRDTTVIGKTLLWSAWPINSIAPTQDVFDELWGWLGKGGKRYLSVRRGTDDDSLWALLFKGDQAELDLSKAPEGVRPTALYEVPKPGHGQAAARAIASFARTAWFNGYVEATSNFCAQPQVDFGSVYDGVKQMTEEEYLQHKAQTKLRGKGEPEDKALLECSSEVRGLRRLEKERESKRKRQEGIVFRLGERGCTKLVYPNDVQKLAAKLGQIFNPLTKLHETVRLAEYVETRLHLEKTLVLWGAGGNQKTPSAEAIAKEFAIAYDKWYIKGNGPEALKHVQEEFESLVTIIFEELSAGDVSQNGKKLSANYLKHLLDVQNGGQVRIRNVMLHFKPRQPRIICVNDTPKEWLQAIEGLKDTDKQPLEKRLLFVHMDELVITDAAVKAHEADLDEIVNAGKRRRREHHSTAGADILMALPWEEPSTSAGSAGGSCAGFSSSSASAKSDADSAAAGSKPEDGQPAMAADGFCTLRNAHGSAIFKGKLGKPEHKKKNYAARFAFRNCTIDSEVLEWMQNDPTLPRSAEEMKRAFKFDGASHKAKQLSDGNKVQLMCNTGGARRSKRCNGLDATAPAPAALTAFARAFKEVNRDALLQLHQRLIERLSTLGDSELGGNGKKLRDMTAEAFIEKVFHFVMLQPMVPQSYREDHKHCDGGASIIHMGLSLYGERHLRFWEKDVDEPYEIRLPPGSVYVSSPACFSHQVVHCDGQADPEQLMAFDGLNSAHCKLAVQFRCSLWNDNRATNPPASPIAAFQAAADVIATWLASAALRLPSKASCEALAAQTNAPAESIGLARACSAAARFRREQKRKRGVGAVQAPREGLLKRQRRQQNVTAAPSSDPTAASCSTSPRAVAPAP